jgi:hypothetical protein
MARTGMWGVFVRGVGWWALERLGSLEEEAIAIDQVEKPSPN